METSSPAGHRWQRRPWGMRTPISDYVAGPGWDQCRNCGMSRAMAEHLDAPCSAGSQVRTETPAKGETT